jgi:hypothetical protein
MATVNKDFRVKSGLIVEGATGTINGSNILTEAASVEFIQDTVGGMVSGNTETNITVTYDDENGKLNFSSTDTNTTYSISSETATGGANVRLTGSDSTTDNVSILGSGATTVTRTNENTITISSTDTNTVTNAFSTIATTSGTNPVAGSTSDTLTLTAGTGISVTGDSATDTVTFANTGVTSVAGTNNEVTVSASTGSVTIGLPDNVTIGGALTVTGDLTVNGTTTTLNTDTLAVEDNIIVLNSNVTSTPSLDAGLEVERGTYTNAKIYWNETENAWYLATPGDNGDAATTAEISTGGSTNLFNTISDGSNTATPDSATDTLTFAAGTGLSVAVNGSTDTVTYSLNSSATAAVGSVTLPDALLGSATATSSGTTATLDTWSATTYSTAKYVIQAKNGSGDIEVTEILVAVDGSNNVYVTEYANFFSNATLAEFTATYASGDVSLGATSTASGVVFKVSKTYLEA